MEFRILGPLEVVDNGRTVDLGARKQQALLAVLLLHPGQVISTARLSQELWGESPPSSAQKALQGYVSGLRKVLGADTIVTKANGYALAVDPDRLDATRFERLARDAHACLAEDPTAAATGFRRALTLWRGSSLEGLDFEGHARSEVDRLEEQRVTTLERRIEADLALGRHAEIVAELRELVAAHPYRERLSADLMLALYRSRRQAEALEVYRETRRVLTDELGIEPGEELRRLERAMLAQAPELDAPRPAPIPPASAERPARAVAGRRLVSALFADVTDSTALAERLDPEALHGLLDRYSALCAEVIERHGGKVEKFVGDAVVGVFGLDALHEDDALRAVRAAVEVRTAATTMGVDVHLGVNSGEVFVGPGARRDTFASGDAIHIAAGLEEAAARGEILLGERTYRLVEASIRAEPVQPLAIKGRAGEVRAWRLLELSASESPLAPATPFTGREAELRTLRDALSRVIRERTCRLLTVVGPPGIGKSRLARELIAGIGGDATVAVGRCLSYGEGITYRPLAEIVRALAGTDPARGLGPLLGGDEQAARRILGAIGPSDEPARAEETFLAVRRLFEAAARQRPLVVVIEDAHWAEPTLLDLVEYLVGFSIGFPILVVCLARPDLLESRPAWAVPEPSRSVLVLEALARAEAEAIVENLGGDELGRPTAHRIVERAEGNPLFLEQLVAVRAEGEVEALPPSIEAVLAARIDRLDPGERSVLARAAVEGRSFHRGAVAALVPDEERDAVAGYLMGLVRRQVIRSEPSELEGEDAFRFAHVLIREVAYGGLPKRLRADLHERMAAWLGDKPPVEDEILGYHLEQAFRHRAELGRVDARDRPLAASASERLATAAHAALMRGDTPAAAGLLERAASLLTPEDPARAALVLRLGGALFEAGRLEDADRVLTEAIEHAGAARDPCLEPRARVERQLARLHLDTEGIDEARQVAESALALLEAHGDELGQCRAWRLRAWIEWTETQAAAADAAWQRAAEHARRAGDERELYEILGWRASAAAFGPMPVAEAIRSCTAIRAQVGGSPVAVAVTLRPLALLHAMTGDFARARELVRDASAILEELGRMQSVVSHHAALVEMMAGEPAAAEQRLREGYARLEDMGERALLATTAAMLAQAIYAQTRWEDAARLCEVSARFAAPEDLVTQAIWRSVSAKLLARGGRVDDGEKLAREAVALLARTDALVEHGDALLALAEVLDLCGRIEEADAAVGEALASYDRKGAVVMADRARSRLQRGPAPNGRR
jgi:DNA-binding SARP family transcriptional activator/tetratricopeptide (TPR) repeat protein